MTNRMQSLPHVPALAGFVRELQSITPVPLRDSLGIVNGSDPSEIHP